MYIATPQSVLPHSLDLICRCGHAGLADLEGLVASGRGDVPLKQLRFTCSACGADQVDKLVSGARMPRWNRWTDPG